LQKNLFNEGNYRLMLLAACYHREWILNPDEENPCVHFEIKGGLSQSPYWYEKRRGLLAPVLIWQAATEE
jgi:lipopolysaccharide transport system ATP-binding protein